MKLVFMLSLGLKATALAQSMRVQMNYKPYFNRPTPIILYENSNKHSFKRVKCRLASHKRPNVLLNGVYAYITPVPGITLSQNGHEQVLKFAPNHSLNTNVSVGQTLYDFGRTNALIRLAADNAQIARGNYEVIRQSLAYQVAAAYYSVGFLQQAILVQDSVIRTAGATVKIVYKTKPRFNMTFIPNRFE